MPNYIFKLSDKVIRKPVSYKNRFGIKISADLYLPKNLMLQRSTQPLLLVRPMAVLKSRDPAFMLKTWQNVVLWL